MTDHPERRTGRERRDNKRIALKMDVAVPVTVRGPDGLERGIARNVSDGGMLIEMEELPAIGSQLEVTFAGLGQIGSPAITLFGEVRHQVAWQHNVHGRSKTMRGVGIRFVDGAENVEHMPVSGEMLH